MSDFSIGVALDKLSYLKSIHSTRNKDFDQRDAIVELDHDSAFGWGAPTTPDDIRIASAQPLKMVKHLTGLFTQNPLRPIATPYKPTKKALEISGQLEKFLLGVLQENEERHGPVLATGVSNGGTRGWGSWRITWNRDLEGGKDDDEHSILPLEWVPVDPSCLYYEKGGRYERFNSCMYAIYRRRADVEREWNTDLGGGENPHDNSSSEVQYVDYWWWDGDTIYNAIFADQTVLKPATAMPGYRRLPYITWFTQPFHTNDPEDWGTGWLHGIRDSIKNWDRAANRQMLRLTRSADNMYVIQQVQDDAQEIDPDWELTVESGKIKAMPKGWHIQPLVNAGPSPEASAMMQVFQQEMQAAGLPGLSMGTLPRGDTDMSGVTFHGIQDAAATWLATDVESFAKTMARIYDLIIGLCSYYSEDRVVVVATRTPGVKLPNVEMVGLTGAKMQGFRLDVVVDTETAAEKMRKQQMGMQLLAMPPEARPFDLRTIQEKYFDIEDPEAIEQAKLVEYVMSQPEMRQYLATLAARKFQLPEPSPPAPSTPPGTQGQAPPPGPGLPGQQMVPPGGPPIPNTLISPQDMGGSPPPMPIPGRLPNVMPARPGVPPR